MIQNDASGLGRLRTTPAGPDTRLRIAMGSSGAEVIRAESYRPVLVIGPQRSGKTTSVVLPALLEWAGPAMVTSVRYDVLDATEVRRAQLGRIQIYDPAGVVNRNEAMGWSPLDGILSWDAAVARAAGLCEGSDTSGLKDGDFWLTKAQQLLAPLIFAVAAAGEPFGRVVAMLSVKPWLLEDTVDSLLSNPAAFGPTDLEREFCMNRLRAATDIPDVTYGGVVATASSVLEVFDYIAVDSRARRSGLRVEEFLDGGAHTLYLCAPARQQRLFRPLFTALVREVLDKAYEVNGHARTEEDQVHLLVCLDEAGNIARLRDLDVLATTAAGTGIQLVSIFHDLSQLRSCYGEDRARLIFNNHSGVLCLSGNRDPATNDLLVSILHDDAVRGLGHRGWNYSDLRGLDKAVGLLVYEELPPALVKLRKAHEDPVLLGLRRPVGLGTEPSPGLQ